MGMGLRLVLGLGTGMRLGIKMEIIERKKNEDKKWKRINPEAAQ
jgi:hypothetical protein